MSAGEQNPEGNRTGGATEQPRGLGTVAATPGTPPATNPGAALT